MFAELLQGWLVEDRQKRYDSLPRRVDQVASLHLRIRFESRALAGAKFHGAEILDRSGEDKKRSVRWFAARCATQLEIADERYWSLIPEENWELMLARLLHCLVIQQSLGAWIDLITSSSEISVPQRQSAVFCSQGTAPLWPLRERGPAS